MYQSISAYASRLDNIVELYGGSPPPIPGVRFDPVTITAVLRHYFEALGGSTVQITFEDTEVSSTGSFSNSAHSFIRLTYTQHIRADKPGTGSHAAFIRAFVNIFCYRKWSMVSMSGHEIGKCKSRSLHGSRSESG